MPGRGKKIKGSTSSVIPKKRIRTAGKRPKSPPMSSTPSQEPLNDLDMTGRKAETENYALAIRVIELLIDISSLETMQHGMDERINAINVFQQ